MECSDTVNILGSDLVGFGVRRGPGGKRIGALVDERMNGLVNRAFESIVALRKFEAAAALESRGPGERENRQAGSGSLLRGGGI